MAFYRSITNRRSRKRVKNTLELQLTSLMDVLVIILVFLLKSYSTSTSNFSTVSGINLPVSGSPDIPPDSLQVIVTPEGMTFEDARILDFIQTQASVGSDTPEYKLKKTDLDRDGHRILPLYDALTQAKEKAELLRTKSTARDKDGNPLPFDGVLAIQADKTIRYETLRKILFTAASAEYKIFRFLALKQEL